eukprot:CAMPEP_0195059422 /NCGR_PEP_ID=MMETSP0448-20130528/6927_1 /TAXON_ID=66468 /ORGANISM="Heterocapsa triquestra, Strain CCMP 448" /LENGTH=37 /DNA_ID= /DNA_START= /DNA_END= /DNA_ORIENTATION=
MGPADAAVHQASRPVLPARHTGLEQLSATGPRHWAWS